jgi:Type II CAAX prenyl endopeptidase Rce1-like
MRLHWPPTPLGLGTPLNLASQSEVTRTIVVRTWWHAVILGLATPMVMLLIDRVFFAGVSLQRIRILGSQPPATRLVIILFSSVTEELIYRVGIATLFAWLAFLLSRHLVTEARNVSQWVGIIVAAIFFGLSHVGNLPGVPHPILRALILNGVAGIAVGWVYWWRGLELAILAHLIADAVLYFVVPVFLR